MKVNVHVRSNFMSSKTFIHQSIAFENLMIPLAKKRGDFGLYQSTLYKVSLWILDYRKANAISSMEKKRYISVHNNINDGVIVHEVSALLD